MNKNSKNAWFIYIIVWLVLLTLILWKPEILLLRLLKDSVLLYMGIVLAMNTTSGIYKK